MEEKIFDCLQLVEDSVRQGGGVAAVAGLLLVPTRTKPSEGRFVSYLLTLVSSEYSAEASLQRRSNQEESEVMEKSGPWLRRNCFRWART